MSSQTAPSSLFPASAGPASQGAAAEESTLVRQAKGGDRGAFGTLVERYGGQLIFALQGRMSDRDAALDVAQEAWVRVARGLDGFHVGQRFRPWLFATAFNVLRDHHRKTGLMPEAGAVTVATAAAQLGRSSEELRAVDEQEAIGLALLEVEEPFQATLRLVDVLGLDYVEAAKSLGCAEGTVKSRLSRGRRAFREAYERLVPRGEAAGEMDRGQSADEAAQVTL